MEVIRLSGYTEIEKMEIAKRFLVPKQRKETGLASDDRIEFTQEGIEELVQHYTREAGVRNLEREIGNVCRKVARSVVNAQTEPKKKEHPKTVVTAAKVNELLGPQKFREQEAEKKNEIGATLGLAWTEVGGSILGTEAAIMEGRGKLTTTGKLGDVMQESAQAAMSYVRSPRPSLWAAARFLPAPRYSLARSRGRDPEGRPFGRNHHRDQYHQRADQHSGARRYRHDRRNHGSRPGAAHWRPEGKAAGGASPRNPRSGAAGRITRRICRTFPISSART